MVGEVFTLGDLNEGSQASVGNSTMALSTTLSAVGGEGFMLDELGFHAPSVGTYELWLDGVLVASVDVPVRDLVYRFTNIATPLASRTIALTVRCSVPARFRALYTRAETHLGHGITIGQWWNFPTTASVAVWIFEIVVTKVKDAAPEWAQPGVLDPGGDGMSRVVSILSRRERVPAYQANGVAGTGGEDVEPVVGQIWPR